MHCTRSFYLRWSHSWMNCIWYHPVEERESTVAMPRYWRSQEHIHFIIFSCTLSLSLMFSTNTYHDCTSVHDRSEFQKWFTNLVLSSHWYSYILNNAWTSVHSYSIYRTILYYVYSRVDIHALFNQLCVVILRVQIIMRMIPWALCHPVQCFHSTLQ